MTQQRQPGSVYSDIVSKIKHLRTRLKTVDLINGFLSWATLFLVSALLLTAIEMLFRMNIPERSLAVGLLVLGLIATAGILIFRPLYILLFKKDVPTDDVLAERVGGKFPHIRDKLVNALQVFRKHRENPEGYSVELIEASIINILEDIQSVDFGAVVDKRPVFKRFRAIGLLLSIWLVFGVLFWGPVRSSGLRLLHPLTEFQTQARFDFDIKPGDIDVLKGESVKLSATINGDEYINEATLILTNLTNQTLVERKLTSSLTGEFEYGIESVKDSMEYAFRIADVISPAHRITIFERPMVRSLQIKLTYPKYTQIPPRFLDENVGDIAALKGTRVQMTLRANKSVEEAWLVYSDSSQVPLKVVDTEIRGKWTLRKSGNWFVKLVDRDSRPNTNPIIYRMDLVDDQYPTIKITVPAADVDLGEDMHLFLAAEALDDFGFSSARLNYRIHKTTLQTLGDSGSIQLKLPSTVHKRRSISNMIGISPNLDYCHPITRVISSKFLITIMSPDPNHRRA